MQLIIKDNKLYRSYGGEIGDIYVNPRNHSYEDDLREAKAEKIVFGKWQINKWIDEKGRYNTKLYNNNAKKPHNGLKKWFIHRNEEQVDKYIEDNKRSNQTWEDKKAENKKKKSEFVNPAKVNDILMSMWGYDQTNIDYYQVIEVKNKSVVIREIGFASMENDGYGSDIVSPCLNKFTGKPMLKRVSGQYKDDPSQYCVRLSSFQYPSLWSGKPNRQTDAYSGH